MLSSQYLSDRRGPRPGRLHSYEVTETHRCTESLITGEPSTWNRDVCQLTKVSLPVRGIETRPRRIIAKIGTILLLRLHAITVRRRRVTTVLCMPIVRQHQRQTHTRTPIAFSIDSAFLWTLHVLMIRNLGLGPGAPRSELFVHLRQADIPTTRWSNFTTIF